MSDLLRERAEENKILEIVVGSHLYGTSTPESDEDFVGIFMPPKEYVLGLQSVKEVDFSKADKDESGKNTAEAVDRKLYEFRRFINLALKNNPNVIEILFAHDKAKAFCNDSGEALLAMREHFPSQQCIPRFIGYAHAQKHKMIIRRDHFNELRNGYDFLGLCDPKLTMGQVYDHMIDCDPDSKTFWKKDTGHHIHCGDICFEPGVYAKKAYKMLKQRLDKATNRSELVLKHGYDTKFASHLIRLLYEGLMLLEQGELIFPLPMASLILDIKHGKWEVEQVIEHADKLETKFEVAQEKTNLPENANYKAIEAFTMEQMSKHLGLP
jgi:hypothetical protein